MSGINPRIGRLLSRLRCPRCRGDMGEQAMQNAHLLCAACRAEYPIQDGVPILLNESDYRRRDHDLNSGTGCAMVQEYRGAHSDPSSTRHRRRWFEWLRPPELIYHSNPELEADHTAPLFTHAGPETLVLNVGGGPKRYREHEVTLNLDAFPNVDAVGDAHNLPFADDTFDSVLCIAVLEHVRDPQSMVSEMIRVARPGGLVYAELPFIFFFHGYPNDFFRYTREGVRHLFSELSDLRVAPVSGPVSAMLQSTNIALSMFVPRFLRKPFNGLFRLGTFWLKYCDALLIRRDEAHLLAAGFYALGRKR